MLRDGTKVYYKPHHRVQGLKGVYDSIQQPFIGQDSLNTAVRGLQ
jgi:hypothetical protein